MTDTVSPDRSAPCGRGVWLTLGLVWLIAMVALCLWWAHVARRRLQMRVDAIAARGEPLTPGEMSAFAPLSTHPSGRYLHRAIAAMSGSVVPPSESTESFPAYPPYGPKWEEMAKRTVEANAAALSLARQARGFDELDWPFTDLVRARELAMVLGDAALYSDLHGDDAEAIERIVDLRNLARCVDSLSSSINELVAGGIESLANERLQVIAAGMRTGDESATHSPTARPAGREVIQKLIAELLDERTFHERARASLLLERESNYQTLGAERNNLSVLRPMADLEIARVLDEEQLHLVAMEKQNWPAALAVILSADPAAQFSRARQSWRIAPGTAPRYSRLISDTYGYGYARVQIDFQMVADRRLVAADLAIHLYLAVHGRWPASLDELVPEYLPAVPVDPFSASGTPLQFVTVNANGHERRLLGYISPERPTPTPPPADWQFGWEVDVGTQWRDLSLPPTPGTQPAGSN
jgi:hypothetical protein